MKNILLTQDFRSMRESGTLYIDKTREILDIVTRARYSAIFRLRRFGKSLTLSTIKELFLGSKELFEGTYIYDKWDWNNSNPVIYISFEAFRKGNDIKDYLVNDAIRVFYRNEDGEIIGQRINFYDYNSISIIIEQLKEVTGKDVVILVDEYNKVYLEGLTESKEEREYLVNEFGRVFDGIKPSQADIEFLLVTGLTKFAKTNLFSTMNNLEELSLSPMIQTLYGITQEELDYYFGDDIQDIAEKEGRAYEDVVNDLYELYGGYRFTRAVEISTVYNPWDILNFFISYYKGGIVYDHYWGETGMPSLIKKMLERMERRDYIDIIEEIKANKPIYIPSIAILSGINPTENIEEDGRDGIIKLLYQSGYLTIVGREGSDLLLFPPNEETEYVMTYDMLRIITGSGVSKLARLSREIYFAIKDLDPERLEENLQEALDVSLGNISISRFDKKREGGLKVWLLMLMEFSNRFHTFNEGDIGYGAPDSIFFDKINGGYYLVEVKAIPDGEKGLEKAENQINDTYLKSFKAKYGDEAKAIISINIFAGKLNGNNVRTVKANISPVY